MYKTFADKLKKRGISIYKASKDTGVSTAVIYNWKNGKTKPRAETLKTLAKYVGVDVAKLIGG